MAGKLKTTNCALHRGRIQAQGDGIEESEPRAQNDIPYKGDGHTMAGLLKKKLSRRAYVMRSKAFERAEKFIDRAPQDGWDISTQSYTGCPPYKDVRVDVEIKKGKAFRDNQ